VGLSLFLQLPVSSVQHYGNLGKRWWALESRADSPGMSVIQDANLVVLCRSFESFLVPAFCVTPALLLWLVPSFGGRLHPWLEDLKSLHAKPATLHTIFGSMGIWCACCIRVSSCTNHSTLECGCFSMVYQVSLAFSFDVMEYGTLELICATDVAVYKP
jgi:hypothetical protein